MLELSLQSISVILTLVNMVLAGLGAVLIYLFRRTAANEKALSEYKLEVADKYAHRADMVALIQQLNDISLRLEQKIEGMGDKLYTMRGQIVD